MGSRVESENFYWIYREEMVASRRFQAILYVIFFFFFASAFPKFLQFSSVQLLSCVRLLGKYFFELLERNPKVLRMKFGHKRGLALFQADNGFLCYPFQV